MQSLKNFPQEERPRERLQREGTSALAISELIAIILGSGTKGKSVLDLSQEVLSHFGSLERLLDATITELMQIKGIGKAKAIQLKAVFGIAACCQKITLPERSPIETPFQAYVLAKGEIADQKQEVLLVLLRDVRGCLIHREKVSAGTLSHVLVHPREIFYPAVRHKAHSMIIAHNHPSGDPTPSSADFQLTSHLIESGKVMGIGLDDHLIVCKDSFLSFYQQGLIPFKSRY
ncbi:MAG: DNA repair protein RadC [Chlamydiales bacterium]|nr:DNA repair protein RadC [Chlamydiales bacterium]